MSETQSALSDFLNKFYGLVILFLVLAAVVLILGGVYIISDKLVAPNVDLRTALGEVNSSVITVKTAVEDQDKKLRDIQYTDERMQKDLRESLEILRELERRGKRTGIGVGATP